MSFRLARVGSLWGRQPGRRWFASASTVSLAYDYHPPPKPGPRDQHPILFMHGLFGSKKNNRGMSK